MEFASLLRTARVAAELTQADIAGRTGIARSNVGAYETGRREPRYSTAVRLLTAAETAVVVDERVTWWWTSSRRPYEDEGVAAVGQQPELSLADLVPQLLSDHMPAAVGWSSMPTVDHLWRPLQPLWSIAPS